MLWVNKSTSRWFVFFKMALGKALSSELVTLHWVVFKCGGSPKKWGVKKSTAHQKSLDTKTQES
jgi:hypothetical protein